jgi:hypothetical protein
MVQLCGSIHGYGDTAGFVENQGPKGLDRLSCEDFSCLWIVYLSRKLVFSAEIYTLRSQLSCFPSLSHAVFGQHVDSSVCKFGSDLQTPLTYPTPNSSSSQFPSQPHSAHFARVENLRLKPEGELKAMR